MEISLPDVQQLQAELGKTIGDQVLRAIVAERRVRELEAEMTTLKAKAASVGAEITSV